GPPGPRQGRGEARIGIDEAGDGVLEVGFGVDEEHERGEASTNAMATQPLSGTAWARMKQPVLRFAPSPNGYLHLGHALSALIDFEMARALGGRFLLRIEDIDAARCRPEFEQAIYEDLAWLGISWQEPVRRQSEHFDAYRVALAKLEAQGLIYPSFESRAEIARHIAQHTGAPWPHDPDGSPLYPGTAKQLSSEERSRRIAAGEAYALRLDMRAAIRRPGALPWVETGADPKQDHETLMAEPQKWGDVVLARKDTPTSYHLSVVLDDALQG